MQPSIFKVSQIGKGTLYVMPRPSSDWLLDDASYFSSIGIHLVVSLLEEHEAIDLGLGKEKEVLLSLGIDFISYPIKDRDLPSRADFVDFIKSLHLRLLQGEHLAIHCRAGIGRAGIVASCILKQDGHNSDVAMRLVSSARGVTIPDTSQQIDYICGFSAQ
jgi:protein-tyrosine phosphatase